LDFADDTFTIGRDVTGKRGLVCFDPQASKVYQPEYVDVSGGLATLELADGCAIDGVDRELVEESVRRLSETN
jgi:hypothetical protein